MPGRGRPKADKTMCRVCKQREPKITMLLVHGKPRGICRDCRQLEAVAGYHRRNLHSFAKKREVTAAAQNHVLLSKLPPGVYRLIFKPKKTYAKNSWIAIRETSIYLQLDKQAKYFEYDLHGVAMFLGNRNLLVTKEKISLVDKDGKPVRITQIGKDLEPKPVSEELQFYDASVWVEAIDKALAKLDSDSE